MKKLLITVFASSLLFIGCTNQQKVENTPQSGDPINVITVVGTDFAFSPNNFTFRDGEKVQINFRNNGKMRHDFVIENEGMQTDVIDPGTMQVLKFTAKEGTYTFYCSVAGHRLQDMEGSFTVVK